MVCGVKRPVIGICAALERARWSVWDQRAALVPCGYASAVQRAGGLALGLLPDEHSAGDPGEVLELIDGLMLADMAKWEDFNKVYFTYFKPGRLPARSAFGACALALGAQVELECWAYAGKK